MGLSSNTLWHQTNYKALINILKTKKVLCSYSIEDVCKVLGQPVAFPMVSMCDLPLSEFAAYLGKYGEYSIGLSREWGVKNKFCPVWYCDPDSLIIDDLKRHYERLANGEAKDGLNLLVRVLAYIKSDEAALLKHNYKKYRFIDEREVRFIPSFRYLLSGEQSPFLTEERYSDYKALKGTSLLIDVGVDFEWMDIKYIVVKEDHQIEKLYTILHRLGYRGNNICVFSANQVKHDFIGIEHNIMTPVDHNQDDKSSADYLNKISMLIHNGPWI